jgi:phosphoribosylanthranilate isomerase
MSVFVKICGLRDAATVNAAVDAGADAIGFVFAKSVRRVTVAQAQEAAQELPEHVQRVAVMKHPTIDEWQEVLEGFAPDVLQTDIVDLADLDVPSQVQAWPVYREGGRIPAERMPCTFVYEGAASGTGETVDWDKAGQVGQKGRMILAGGLSAENVAEAIRTSQPWGVDVSSGVESQPGQKDVNRIGEFISAVRAAEKEV